MPTYRVKDIETEEEFEVQKGISEMEEYLKENPNLKRIVCGKPNIGDPIRLGVKKNSGGFKEVMEKIHERAPGSILKDNFNW